MYRRYHEFIIRQITDHRGGRRAAASPDLSAWALIGMGTISSIGRELGVLAPDLRRRLWERIGPLLLGERR